MAGVSTTKHGQARQKRCFYCNKVGRLRRNCRIRLDALKRTAPVKPTSVPPQWLAPRRNGIVGLRTFGLPRVTVQLGHLTIRALLDSGSARSIISQEFFMKLQRVDPTLRYGDTSINCISISRQPLRVVGLHLKIQGFSWNFPLVVVKGSACEFILGSGFISKTGLVLDIAKQEFYFHFSPQKFKLAPSVRSNFCLQGMAPVSDTSQYAPV